MTVQGSSENTKRTHTSSISGIVSRYDIDDITMENHVCCLYFEMNIDKMKDPK